MKEKEVRKAFAENVVMNKPMVERLVCVVDRAELALGCLQKYGENGDSSLDEQLFDHAIEWLEQCVSIGKAAISTPTK